MPRPEEELLQKQDDQRLTSSSGQRRLDYLYRNMAKFRHDMRFMTVTWGLLLITAFIVKVIVVMTSTDIGKAQLYGYVLFGLAAFFMTVFTWFYTYIIKGHVVDQVAFWRSEEEQKKMDGNTEAVQNANWGVNTMSNAFSQVAG
jgi:fatty acid desaturase